MADHVGLTGLPLSTAARGQTPPLVYIQAALSILVGLIAIIAFFRLVGTRLNTPPQAVWLSLLLYAAVSVTVLAKLPTYPHGRFGPANVVTTFRSAIVAAIGGIVLAGQQFPHILSQDALWLVMGAAASVLFLDGCDGYLARRYGTSSRYGARFDMEIDALLILLLSVAVFLTGKAGAWVLLIGLMRYGFLLGQMTFERLSGELADSRRRKAVCVAQGMALCIGLAPAAHPRISALVLSFALLSLILSFAVDTAYLWKQGRETQNGS